MSRHVCELCGTKFLSRTKDNPNRFCCTDCSKKWLSQFKLVDTVEGVCGYCGKDFKPRKADLKKGWGKFCTRKCYQNYRATSFEFYRLFYTEKGYEDLPVRSDLCVEAKDPKEATRIARLLFKKNFILVQVLGECHPTNILYKRQHQCMGIK